MKKIRQLIFFMIVIYGLSKFCHYQTDGFAMTKLSTELLEEPISSLEEELLKPKYQYVGKGGQSYVFVSDDGKYILKFFRSSRLNTLKIFHLFFPLAFLRRKIQHQEKLIRETLESYGIAKKYLSKETALLGMHLDTSLHLSHPLQLIDKLGFCHTINPNYYPFVIQEKAVLLKEQIASLMQEKNSQKASQALKNLFILIQLQIEKGIQDQDPNLSKNFGFCNDRPVQIDGGRYKINVSFSKEKIEKSKEDLQNWINQKYPELSETFHTFYEEFIHEAI